MKTIFITTCIHYSSVSLNISHNFISLGISESNLRWFYHPAISVPCYSNFLTHPLPIYANIWILSAFLKSNIYVTRYKFHEPFLQGLCCLWLGWPLSSLHGIFSSHYVSFAVRPSLSFPPMTAYLTSLPSSQPAWCLGPDSHVRIVFPSSPRPRERASSANVK